MTTAEPSTNVDAPAIAAVLIEKMEQAWNRADGAGFATAFTDDADFVDIHGTLHQGRIAIGHGHQAILDGIVVSEHPCGGPRLTTAAARTEPSARFPPGARRSTPAGHLQAVARAGNVSIDFLYREPQLRARIEELRAATRVVEPETTPSRSTVVHALTLRAAQPPS